MNNEIPELWRICSSTSIKDFLDKNNKVFKVVDKGKGINSGEEICDYLATKDGWHKFSLKKRLEAEIITTEEYKYALKCYETIRKKLPDEFWKKKIRKDIYLIWIIIVKNTSSDSFLRHKKKQYIAKYKQINHIKYFLIIKNYIIIIWKNIWITKQRLYQMTASLCMK